MIVAQGLSKSYRFFSQQQGFWGRLLHPHPETRPALNDVSLQIGSGELVGYVGPNGAGKSTTVKILCGVMSPDAGTCRVCGRDPSRERISVSRQVGVVFGHRGMLLGENTVDDNLELLRRVFGIQRGHHNDLLSQVEAFLPISSLRNRLVRTLSLGERMRCEIAASLAHDPKVLLLDEPTVGLDIDGRIGLRSLLRTWAKEKGICVLLTTHDLQELQNLCERIILLNKGSVLYDGTLIGLRGIVTRVVNVRIAFVSPIEGLEVAASHLTVSARCEGPGEYVFGLDDEGQIATVIKYLSELGPIKSIDILREPIEEVIQSAYKIATAGGIETAFGR